MLSREVLRQVRRIEIVTNRLVNEALAGRYASSFKGRGIEFDEVREYQPGDEVRLIDWNVTARTGRPYIKRFVEERELSVLFLVDLSRSMAFGSSRQMKQRLAAELCAVLAFSAIKNQDRVGLVLFSDRIERFLPPRKGARHVLRVIREVLSFAPAGDGTDLAGALEYLNRAVRRPSVVFLLSDFFAGDFRRPLAVTNRRHDVIAVHLTDPREEELPRVGWLRLEDAETGRPWLLNAGAAAVRRQHAEWARAHRQRLAEIARETGVDVVQIRTDRPYLEPLLRFLHMRAMRR
jgi:uncharacterized protein (DUF58 family)